MDDFNNFQRGCVDDVYSKVYDIRRYNNIIYQNEDGNDVNDLRDIKIVIGKTRPRKLYNTAILWSGCGWYNEYDSLDQAKTYADLFINRLEQNGSRYRENDRHIDIPDMSLFTWSKEMIFSHEFLIFCFGIFIGYCFL
jgi:hypothetical protein